jgi:subtilisin family serine protease
LLKYKDDRIDIATPTGQAAATEFYRSKSLQVKENYPNVNLSLVKIDSADTITKKINELKNDPNVEYAEPNYKKTITSISINDTYKDSLWGLDNFGQSVNGVIGTTDKDIDAPEAWNINEGTNGEIVVAVLDTGVAYNHPDLISNMWDGTNCKDFKGIFLGSCAHGYDFEDEDKYPLPTSSYHGTHIAGTIAATKNNSTGVAGVAPNAKIMAIKMRMDIASEIKSIDFAIQNGAKIINASYGGVDFSQSEYDAINRFKNVGGIFVAAAGNGGYDSIGDNNDSIHYYPSDYDLDNIISVAATDQNDGLATFSNYGLSSVDVGAPGTNIYSTISSSSTIANESFSSVVVPALPNNWSKTDNWGTYDLSGSWGKVLYGDLNYPTYVGNANSTVTSPIYNLGSSGGTLDFWASCDTEYVDNGWSDYMQLEYSADGINFMPADNPLFPGSEFRWDEAELDYLNGDNNPSGNAIFHFENIAIPNEYSTDSFRYRFRWVTNETDNTYDGCFVDDIRITQYSDGSDETYAFAQGTSMATPQVSGLAALIKGYNTNLNYKQVRDIILGSGDDIVSLHGKTTSGKRINAYNALLIADPVNFIDTPIYRLYNTMNGAYLYVRGDADKTHVMTTWPEFEFTDGVPAFYASLVPGSGLTPIYRLYNTKNGAYLYARGEADKQHVMNTWPEFEYTDGVPAFYAPLNDPGGLTPIYRLYNTLNGMYLYTRGVADMNHVLTTWPEFEYTDGVPAFYASLN